MAILRVRNNEGRTDEKVEVHGGADHRGAQGARGGDAGNSPIQGWVGVPSSSPVEVRFHRSEKLLKIHRGAIVLAATLVVAACGGGGSSAPTTNVTSTVSSSASPHSSTAATNAPSSAVSSPASSSSPNAGQVSIVSLTTPVGLGATATLTASAIRGLTCTIVYIHPSGKTSVAAELIPKVVGSDGLVSWSWLISPGTAPVGIGKVTVTCNGVSAEAPIAIQ
jgi:hypothetical protein